jgi:hypothetical protein
MDDEALRKAMIAAAQDDAARASRERVCAPLAEIFR